MKKYTEINDIANFSETIQQAIQLKKIHFNFQNWESIKPW
jgi:hypothetical protein